MELVWHQAIQRQPVQDREDPAQDQGMRAIQEEPQRQSEKPDNGNYYEGYGDEDGNWTTSTVCRGIHESLDR